MISSYISTLTDVCRQQDQFKAAYGETAGAALGAVVRPLARTPDQGSLSILWASVAEDARDASKYENGSYFSDPKVIGGESNEGKDQEVSFYCRELLDADHIIQLIDNFFETSEKVLADVVGQANIGSW